jgi:hypothetical protein
MTNIKISESRKSTLTFHELSKYCLYEIVEAPLQADIGKKVYTAFDIQYYVVRLIEFSEKDNITLIWSHDLSNYRFIPVTRSLAITLSVI